jgi:hypothetical protein
MTTVRFVSKILFYLSRFLAIVYFWMATHSAIALATGWSLLFKDNGKYFQICYPFTQKSFLLGDYNLPYVILDFLGPLSLYGLFFLLLSNVFKVFFQPKLFTEYGIKHLKRFYLANFTLPSLVVLLASIFSILDEGVFVLVLLHAILGIFAYFIAAIFQQGVQLQTEQDLII